MLLYFSSRFVSSSKPKKKKKAFPIFFIYWQTTVPLQVFFLFSKLQQLKAVLISIIYVKNNKSKPNTIFNNIPCSLELHYYS